MLGFTLIRAEAQRQGWALIARSTVLSTLHAQGEAIASIMATFSQLERRLI